jgi:hypothetical protein
MQKLHSVVRRFVVGAVSCLTLLLASPIMAAADDEFVGPFPSWRDLKRDYGARGDGRTDDTAALQRALDDLVKHTNACVLYLPAGDYRLTSTVKTVRKAHTDCLGATVVGEDPARTIVRWDGPAGGTIFQWDAWYSKISRLTLDGAGRAGAALLYGPAFSTYNETSDMVFRDCAVGLQFGDAKTQGQAENAVLRCQFLRCTNAGLLTVNWNSMDIWVWHSRFEDCGRGVHNIMGNYHVWESQFARSRLADVSIQNLMVFSIVNNFSHGSRRFLDFDSGHSWGSPVSITGNRVLEPTDDLPVRLGNAGPYLFVDNLLLLPSGSTNRAVKMTWADQTFVGNTYNVTNAVQEQGRFRRVAEKIVPGDAVRPLPPALPPTPPRRERKIIEVPAGATAEAIQQAIDDAAKLSGQRPVVHLPMGVFKIAKTITIPRSADLQVIGDGGAETGTRLNWAGPAGGVVLRLEGPSRATLHDFYIHAPNARAIVVEDADQAGGKIFADQLNVSGPSGKSAARTAALRVSGLSQTDVLLRCLQGNGNSGAWVDVAGGGEARPSATANQVSICNGATGTAAGQYEVRQGGRLVVRGVYHERSADSLRGIYLADSGTLTIDATRFSYATSAKSPTVAAHDFKGLFTLATCILMPVETTNTCRFEMDGDGSAASVLSLNNQFWVLEPGITAEKVWLNRATPPARGGLVGCNMNSPVKGVLTNGFAFLQNLGDSPDMARSPKGSGPLEDHGGVDDATLLKHLAPIREARVWVPGQTAPGVTDLRIYRVMADGGYEATVEVRK